MGPMSTKKMSSGPRTTPGSDRAMKSLVVFEPQRTMMWCQPRRMPRAERVSRAAALASSSAIPTSTCRAMACTAHRVLARTAMRPSTVNRSPVASRSVNVVIGSPLGGDGLSVDGVQASGVLAGHHQHLDRAADGPQPVGTVGGQVGTAPGLQEVLGAVVLEAQGAG